MIIIYLLIGILAVIVIELWQKVKWLERMAEQEVTSLRIMPTRASTIKMIRELPRINSEKLFEQLQFNLDFLYNQNAIFVTTYQEKTQSYFVPYKRFGNTRLADVELGKTKDGKKITFHLKMRLYKNHDEFGFMPLITGYLKQGEDDFFPKRKKAKASILFDFPEALLNGNPYWLHLWKEGKEVKANLKKLLKKFRLKEEHYDSDVLKDDLGEHQIFSVYTYKSKYFDFAQAEGI